MQHICEARILCFKAVGESFCSLNMSDMERAPKSTDNHSCPGQTQTRDLQIDCCKDLTYKKMERAYGMMACELFG
jgi:hypothetical protein